MTAQTTPSSKQEQARYTFTERDKFWMNHKLYQLWRFIVLNIKILKAVDHSKRS